MSPHGYLLAVAHFKSIDFYELSTLQHVMQIPVYETDETPYLCRFSPDGRQLAVITIHNELRVYDVIYGTAHRFQAGLAWRLGEMLRVFSRWTTPGNRWERYVGVAVGYESTVHTGGGRSRR